MKLLICKSSKFTKEPEQVVPKSHHMFLKKKIIKKQLQIKTFYQFVGGAYVHSKIDSEYFAQIEAEGWEDEIVFLI